MKFDGVGHMTGSATAVANGVSSTGALGGTYTVNSNGMGVIVYTTNFPAPGDQSAIVLNSAVLGLAHGFQFFDTVNAVYLTSGTASLLSTTARTYSVASVHGSFAVKYSTLTADPELYEEGGIGILTFDGEGHIEGSLLDEDSGGLHTPTLTGTYTVNPDGTCSMSLAIANSDFPDFACALNSEGIRGAEGLQAVVTNPGPSGPDNSVNYVVIATAAKQNTP